MQRTIATERGEIIIRMTREADAEAYRELRLEALRSAPTAFGTDPETVAQRTPEQWLADMRAGRGEGTWARLVAQAGDQLVAMTVLEIDAGPKVQHQCHVYSVYVRPAWRGWGILDALFGLGLEWAQGKGACIAKLSVTATNTAAIRAYTRMGFSVYGMDPEVIMWDRKLYDELLMYRRLNDRLSR